MEAMETLQWLWAERRSSFDGLKRISLVSVVGCEFRRGNGKAPALEVHAQVNYLYNCLVAVVRLLLCLQNAEEAATWQCAHWLRQPGCIDASPCEDPLESPEVTEWLMCVDKWAYVYAWTLNSK
jgi:hypothetical protein